MHFFQLSHFIFHLQQHKNINIYKNGVQNIGRKVYY